MGRTVLERSVAISDVDESMLQRRDEMLAPVEEQLGRKLKRVLTGRAERAARSHSG